MEPLLYNVMTGKNPSVRDKILDLTPTMAKIFPELKGVTLKIANSRSSWHVASYEWRSGRIEMQFRYFEKDQSNTLPFVLAHETMHAVQWMRRSVPHGERSCDVFTLARLPIELFPKKKAFYVKIPQRLLSDPSMIRDLANQAISRRRNGLRRYITWFENELNS